MPRKSAEPMRIVIASDPHLYEFPQFNRPTKTGVGSRLRWSIQSLLDAANHAESIQALGLVIPGDLLYVPDVAEASVYVPIIKVVRQILKRTKLLITLGNHDIAGTGLSLLEPLKMIPGVTLIDHTNYHKWLPGEWEGLQVVAVPYFRPENAKLVRLACRRADKHLDTSRPSVGLFHHDIQGIKFHDGASVDTPLRLGDLCERTTLNIHGHYHESKQTGSHLFAGSVTPINFSDAGMDRGFWTVELGKTAKITFTKSRAPHFSQFTAGIKDGQSGLKLDKIRGHYVRVTDVPSDKVGEWRTYLEKYDPAGIDIVEEVSKTISNQRARISARLPMRKILKRYVKQATMPSGWKRDDLLALGLKYARRAGAVE